jgi:predicted nuclease of predicted toxin-antitoxin system
MNLWIDAQLSPAIASWITENFPVTAVALRDLGLRDATDPIIFNAAKNADVIVMTKDADFPQLLEQSGPPPKIIWLTCGNTSNKNLKVILTATLQLALDLLEAGESLVEISGL